MAFPLKFLWELGGFSKSTKLCGNMNFMGIAWQFLSLKELQFRVMRLSLAQWFWRGLWESGTEFHSRADQHSSEKNFDFADGQHTFNSVYRHHFFAGSCQCGQDISNCEAFGSLSRRFPERLGQQPPGIGDICGLCKFSPFPITVVNRVHLSHHLNCSRVRAPSLGEGPTPQFSDIGYLKWL
jgi:hypothetical protein